MSKNKKRKNNKTIQKAKAKKQPIFKKWYFWLLVATVIIAAVVAIVMVTIPKDDNVSPITTNQSYKKIDPTGMIVAEACSALEANGWKVEDKIEQSGSVTFGETNCSNSDKHATISKYAYSNKDHTVKLEFKWDTPDDYENIIKGKLLSEACALFESYEWECSHAFLDESSKGTAYYQLDIQLNDSNAFVSSVMLDDHRVIFLIDSKEYMNRTGIDTNNQNNKSTRSAY